MISHWFSCNDSREQFMGNGEFHLLSVKWYVSITVLAYFTDGKLIRIGQGIFLFMTNKWLICFYTIVSPFPLDLSRSLFPSFALYSSIISFSHTFPGLSISHFLSIFTLIRTHAYLQKQLCKRMHKMAHDHTTVCTNSHLRVRKSIT